MRCYHVNLGGTPSFILVDLFLQLRVFLWLKASLTPLQTYCCSLWPNSLFHLTAEFSSRGFFLCPRDQQQTSVELWGAASEARASFSHGSLSAHGDAKHSDCGHWHLQQLLILVDSWPSWSLVSQQQVTVCVYIGYHLKKKYEPCLDVILALATFSSYTVLVLFFLHWPLKIVS